MVCKEVGNILRLVGYTLAVLGGVYSIAAIALSDIQGGNGIVFKVASAFFVVSWLLLRLAAGLFPFGRQIFK